MVLKNCDVSSEEAASKAFVSFRGEPRRSSNRVFAMSQGGRAMALQNPEPFYTAANNLEAYLLRDALLASAIEAHVVEDVSQAGVWMGGYTSQIHKPQVWIDRSALDRAQPILEAFEHRAAQPPDTHAEPDTSDASIKVLCEECGAHSFFPRSERGRVQQCPHCDAYVDVVEAKKRLAKTSSKGRKPGWAIFTVSFGANLLMLGFAIGYIDVFWLGNWDPKFGPRGSFELAMTFLLVLTGVLTLVTALVTVLTSFAERLSGWSNRRLLLGGFVAALSVFLCAALCSVLGL
jgi:hypothetical protein